MDKYIELGSNENKIVFCGGYDTPTLLQNLQKKVFNVKGCGILQTRYQLWSTIKSYVL